MVRPTVSTSGEQAPEPCSVVFIDFYLSKYCAVGHRLQRMYKCMYIYPFLDATQQVVSDSAHANAPFSALEAFLRLLSLAS